MSLKYSNQYKGSDKEEFLKAVNKYADKLKIKADWLMTLMFSESQLDPKADNGIGFVGLIQFGSQARERLGVSKDEILKMSGAKQMEYVYKYFVAYAKLGLIKQFTDLYLVTFYPNAGGVHGGTFSKPDNWKFPKKVTKANNGIWTNKTILFDDKSNDISLKSFRAWAEAKIPKEDRQKENITTDSISSTANKPTSTNQKEDRVDAKFIIYIHNYSSIKTLDELIRYKNWNEPGKKDQPSGVQLLDYEDNKNSIRASLSKKESRDVPDSELSSNLSIGTKLKIPIDWVQPEFLQFDGSTLVFPNDDIETFISDAMLKATASPEYRMNFKAGTKDGSVRKMVPKPRVWIWCKSLGIELPTDANVPRFPSNGVIFDLSPFLTDLVIHVGGAAGTFSFSLPPLVCECTKTGWKVKPGSTHEFKKKDGAGETNFSHKGYVNYQTENNELKRSKFLFHQMISANDVVWISMDNPAVDPIEGLKGLSEEYNIQNPKVDPSQLPNRFWDMIGLVDSVPQSYSAPNAAVGINVSGRDCMKLLIEDSSYYLTLPDEQERAIKAEGNFVNDNPENWGRPARVSSVNMTSKLFSLQIASARTIGEMMSFIISSMAAIEIAPDKLFRGYQEQENSGNGFGISRYEFFDYKTNKLTTYKAAGIWQIIKLQIDDYACNDRTVIENRLAVHSGSLVNAMKLFADDVFVEFFGDTYVDQFFIMVRRPPFNKKGVLDYITKITGAAPKGLAFDVDQTKEKKASNGSLLKNSKDFINAQNSGSYKDNGQTIDDSMVVSEQLDWYAGEVYSWYRISLPSGNAADRTYASDKFPVIFFREYCEIWGNKALDVQSNYVPWNKIPLKSTAKEITTTFETQLYEDLAFLVESNAYQPFTRTGTITIKGERRIKAKTWIRYTPTGEVFYVESVVNHWNINEESTDRLTTVTVSRGMVEYNSAGQYILPLYFQIIDGLPNSQKSENDSLKDETKDTRILNVYFDFDKSTLITVDRQDLTNADLIHNRAERLALAKKGDESMESLLKELINSPDISVEITGHTDQNGDVIYNEELSQRRSATIKQELVRLYKNSTKKNDIEVTDFAKRITTSGAGESKPLKTNQGTSGDEKRLIDARNRRIEVTVKKKGNIENNSPSKSSKENNFSSWRVNPSVFNFFKARRQFCESVSNFESIPNYVEQVKPTELEVEEKVNTNNSEMKLNEGQTGDFLHNNEKTLNQVDTEFSTIFVAGKFDYLDDIQNVG